MGRVMEFSRLGRKLVVVPICLLVLLSPLFLQASIAPKAFADTMYPELISIPDTGGPSNGWSAVGGDAHHMSDDGRFVVFASNATNMDSDFTFMPEQTQVFVRDRVAQTTELLSIGPDGAPLYVLDFSFLGVSGNGRYAFFSGSDSGSGFPNPKIYRYDIQQKIVELVSVDENNQELRWVDYSRIGISQDGESIAFGLSDLVAHTTDVYVRNIANNTHYLVNNGNWPLLNSAATTVVFSRPTSSGLQAVVYDVASSTETIVHQWETNWRVDGFSRNGRYIFFMSQESDVLPNTPSVCQNSGCTYRKDLATGELKLIEVTMNGQTTWPSVILQSYISGDGERILATDVDDPNDGVCVYTCISETGLFVYDFVSDTARDVGYARNRQVPAPVTNYAGGITYDAGEIVVDSFAPEFDLNTTCQITNNMPCSEVFVLSTNPGMSTDPLTISFGALADTYIRSGNSNRNHGAATAMQVRSSGDNRALVRFEQSAISSAVGGGTVLSAKLRLTITDNGDNWGGTGRTVDVHRLLADWAEGNGTESDRGTGNGATWNCATDSIIQNLVKNCSGSTEWEMGQPNNPSVHPWFEASTATQTITNGQSGVVEFDVTTDVASFVSGAADNYGWIIKKTNEGQNGQVGFGTKESSFAPELVIVFQP
jgi:hypothetical protein